jgi:pilus assembly protein CpaE
MSNLAYSPESSFDASLVIGVIGPDRQRRIAASSALARSGHVQTRDIEADAATLDEIRALLGRAFDAALIDLDGDPARSLALVEGLCLDSSLIVMVYSSRLDPDLMVRAMRAGAREYFTAPFDLGTIGRALTWISTHRKPAPAAKRANGRMHIFFGSKGGVGVTTVACNFAVALATHSRQSTLLIDLNVLLGDAALNLGIRPAYSIADALQNALRLDHNLLETFLTRHASGLAVLPAPAEMPNGLPSGADIGRLLAVARQQFDHIVIDAGKKIDLNQMHLFVNSATAYLVTQVGIPELRNANRLIAQFSAENSPKLEVVVNRYQPRFLGLSDEDLNKALTRPIQWKVPNDFKAVSTMQSTGTPFVTQDSPIAAVLRKMAEAASGVSTPSEPAAASSSGWLGRRRPPVPNDMGRSTPSHAV